ncbi:DUF125-domain-containing protein [Lepidopterella palustris CBS 459.81]|uniref:DUF125-domain-containing protein n=1 Tax=Lepidopterella palustris CBS 459.81 TaxID=1314670 RepID=A0A8E2EDC4_9PEZI|nr:DUF125-domain-containing protein [Lepidopterella palustris CBS 459.81]
MVLVSLKNIFFSPQNIYPKHRYTPIDLENTLASSSVSRISTEHISPSESAHFVDKFEGNEPFLDASTKSTSTPRNSIDPRIVSDATLGLSDGLTVPFAVTAGLSALGSSRIVVFGGLAELLAGGLSMGIGGWLSASTEAESYASKLRSTQLLVKNSPNTAISLARSTLQPYLSNPSSNMDMTSNPKLLTNFLMRFYHDIPEPSSTRGAGLSALIIASGYFIGGFIPLLPYFFVNEIGRAFWWSVGVMVFAQFVFGWGKTWITIRESEDESGLWDGGAGRGNGRAVIAWKCFKGGIQMVVLGGIAAGAAMSVGMVFDSSGAGGERSKRAQVW